MGSPKRPLLCSELLSCNLCKVIFAARATSNQPRPVCQGTNFSKELIASQALGSRVHGSRKPLVGRRGERLRDFMAIDHDTFIMQFELLSCQRVFVFPDTILRELICRVL